MDLGAGSGLSTATCSTLGAFVIALDLSSEMLRSSEWQHLEGHVDRLRGDLAQPLPFREQVFDLLYSVSAVHYVAQDAAKRSGRERIRCLTRSLKSIRAEKAYPCTLQAYLTRDSKAIEDFKEVAKLDGFNTQLVVDQSHGQKAELFLFIRCI